ncbi:hypothetical protein IAQ61_006435 [Plenodomus lingam]|uniref:Kinetochore protein mis14 n=1 Tax=Leptosphaeria maculans (strain JN3 / isolate v23.1.3 / race Av1-4-5-6-7-8) TaxID=985895 RepID=E5AF51_LEPMJ|nr:hypothetical protein LEMA_P006270.1 [Plenodomus lingam JN3]KAH9869230.1 hypothetical protein IAQ61_006435 [Plenodomus lingam]CBY01840.1 hypothetical protein LEMA_P006270.1 [Plenodomus lingam JN3]
MDSEHRKVELQSPADLAYLTSRIRLAARQKLDLHLPPVKDGSNSPDELRTQVESLVDAFVANVLQGMRNNISINGLDVVARGRSGEDEGEERGEAMEGVVGADFAGADAGNAISEAEKEEYEPFDEKLRARLAAQVARRDALVAKISAHRRTTPKAAAAAWQARFEAEAEGLTREMAGWEKMAGMVGEQDVARVEPLSRADEVQRNWERAVEGLARLNKGLPETRARLERCGHVVGYLGEEKK